MYITVNVQFFTAALYISFGFFFVNMITLPPPPTPPKMNKIKLCFFYHVMNVMGVSLYIPVRRKYVKWLPHELWYIYSYMYSTSYRLPNIQLFRFFDKFWYCYAYTNALWNSLFVREILFRFMNDSERIWIIYKINNLTTDQGIWNGLFNHFFSLHRIIEILKIVLNENVGNVGG